MTRFERLLLIALVTVLMIVWSVACAVITDATEVYTGVVKPLAPDVASEPLERIPYPDDILEETETVVEDEAVEAEIEAEITDEIIEEVEYFDIPLDEALQDHIFALCEASGVDVAIVLAVIDKESRFDIYAVGDAGRALGLMQIHPRWHSARMAKLECWDLMDPYQNVTVGIDIIVELASSGKSIEWVLMAYNGGEAYADRKVAAGEVSDYAVEVLGMAERYLVE